jgi:phosphopantetheinyl transferase (holo-ACP synthase)
VERGAVGIDVVDLDEVRARQLASHRRFVDRVCAPDEKQALARADRPQELLWALWAGKEAGFKVVTLLEGRAPVFHHARFQVRLDAPAAVAAAGTVTGDVRYGELVLPLRVTRQTDSLVGLSWRPSRESSDDENSVHWSSMGLDEAIATLVDPDTQPGDLTALLQARFSPAEARPVRSLPSALARLGLRRTAAQILGVDEARLGVICGPGAHGRVPPVLHLDQAPLAGVGVSLSHHGTHVAWALRTPAADTEA